VNAPNVKTRQPDRSRERTSGVWVFESSAPGQAQNRGLIVWGSKKKGRGPRRGGGEMQSSPAQKLGKKRDLQWDRGGKKGMGTANSAMKHATGGGRRQRAVQNWGRRVYFSETRGRSSRTRRDAARARKPRKASDRFGGRAYEYSSSCHQGKGDQ